MGWKFRAVTFMRYICHKIEFKEPVTWFLLCRHSTTLKHHAWLWMLCAISMVTRIFVRWPYIYVQFCVLRYLSTVQTNPKRMHFWMDSLLNLTLEYLKSRRITHYSKCLQVIIQEEMLMKVWVCESQYLSNYTSCNYIYIFQMKSHDFLMQFGINKQL